MEYYALGNCRNSTVTLVTDKLFTGQRLDDTGLYYYGARYYDPTIGRFISPDAFVQLSTGLNMVSYPLTVNAIHLGLGSIRAIQGAYPVPILLPPINPQSLNRYSYVLNNPLRYVDITGENPLIIALCILSVGLVTFGYWVRNIWGDNPSPQRIHDDLTRTPSPPTPQPTKPAFPEWRPKEYPEWRAAPSKPEPTAPEPSLPITKTESST